MLRCIIAGTSSAALGGLAFAVAGSTVYGTATVPFIIGSSLGYAMGAWKWYRASVFEALRDLRAYPELMRLHIIAGFPWVTTLRDREPGW
jgi:hypothetical protein